MSDPVAPRPSRKKRIIRFVVTVAISLIVGRVATLLLNPASVAHLQVLQNQAYLAVSAFSPWELGGRYLCNVTSVSTGRDCNAGSDVAIGLHPDAAPRGNESSGNGLAAPLEALFMLLWQLLFHPSPIGTLFALLEFGGGFALALWISRRWEKSAAFLLLWVPLGTILCACILGWCTQMLMFGGLALFGWITGLAGLCCGTAGLGYFGYEVAITAVGVKAQSSLEGRIVH